MSPLVCRDYPVNSNPVDVLKVFELRAPTKDDLKPHLGGGYNLLLSRLRQVSCLGRDAALAGGRRFLCLPVGIVASPIAAA
jgi:hypothetical protein